MNPSLEWTIATLTSLSQIGYTGKIDVNFFQGGVSGINLSQSVKPMSEVRIIPMGHEVLINRI